MLIAVVLIKKKACREKLTKTFIKLKLVRYSGFVIRDSGFKKLKLVRDSAKNVSTKETLSLYA